MGISNIASNLRPGICTSTTRPTTPYEGQVIYETDTNRTLVWDNSAWVDPSTGKTGQSGLVLITQGTSSGTTAYNYDGVFTTSFRNYRVILDNINVQNAGRALRWNYRVGGATNSNANYDYGYNGYKANGTTNNTSSAGLTFAEIGVYLDTGANEYGAASIDIYAPTDAKRTMATSIAQGLETAFYWRSGGFVQTQETAFDGFRITLNSTGNVSYGYAIYGYNQ